jgi:hypothetical protein
MAGIRDPPRGPGLGEMNSGIDRGGEENWVRWIAEFTPDFPGGLPHPSQGVLDASSRRVGSAGASGSEVACAALRGGRAKLARRRVQLSVILFGPVIVEGCLRISRFLSVAGWISPSWKVASNSSALLVQVNCWHRSL